LEVLQVLAIRSAHSRDHQRRADGRESGWFGGELRNLGHGTVTRISVTTSTAAILTP
jgi:hypothetical protein